MANTSFSSGTSLLLAGLPAVLAIALVVRAHAAESANLSVGARKANARSVMKILREQVLPLKPEFVLTGHDEHTNGTTFWEGVLRASEDALRNAENWRKQ